MNNRSFVSLNRLIMREIISIVLNQSIGNFTLFLPFFSIRRVIIYLLLNTSFATLTRVVLTLEGHK